MAAASDEEDKIDEGVEEDGTIEDVKSTSKGADDDVAAATEDENEFKEISEY